MEDVRTFADILSLHANGCHCLETSPQFLRKQVVTIGARYLKEDIRGIVQTHHHGASSYHVVGVGKRDEQYGGQVVDEHDHKILPPEGEGERERDRNSMKYRMME